MDLIRGSPYRPAASEDAVKGRPDRRPHRPHAERVRNFLHHGWQRQKALHEVPSARQWPPPRRRLVRQPRIGPRTTPPTIAEEGWARPSPAGPVGRCVLSQKWCRCSRQPDITDAQWLQRLHSFGLSRASFRPKVQIAEPRSYVRQRERLIGYAASHIKHMHKALTEINLQLHQVSPTSPAPPAAPHPRDPCRRARS